MWVLVLWPIGLATGHVILYNSDAFTHRGRTGTVARVVFKVEK